MVTLIGGVAYKERYHVKQFVKNNRFLFEQAKLFGRWKRKLQGGEAGYSREIDSNKSAWNLVFDANKSLGQYQRFWGSIGAESFKEGVLSGRAGQLFKYIKETNRRVGDGTFDGNAFRYFRAHNLYSNGEPPWGEGLDIYQVNEDGRVWHNWDMMHQVFDKLRSVDLKPIIEFGFMPDKLASIPGRRQKWGKANISPPKDYKKWQNLVHQTVKQLVERHGEQEVASWYFEVWNEPDLGWLFWIEDERPNRKPYGDVAEYHKLYDHTLLAAKSAFPALKVGGPASAGGDIDLLMEHIYARGNGKYGAYSPIDFTSSHGYGLVGYDHKMDRKLSLLAKLHWKLNSSMSHDHAEIRQNMQTLPFLLTETGPKYNTKRIRNHGRYMAAWYAKMVDGMFYMGDVLGPQFRPKEIVYWSAHQVVRKFEQQKGGIAGSVKMDGHSRVFKLPIYNTIEAFAHLSPERIALVKGSQFGETVHAIATKNGDKSIEILLYHIDEHINERRGQNTKPDSLRIRLTIDNMPFRQFKLEHYAIDENHSNTYSLWRELGRPKKIGKEEDRKMRGRQDLMLYSPVQRFDIREKNQFQLDVKVQALSVHLVKLQRMKL